MREMYRIAKVAVILSVMVAIAWGIFVYDSYIVFWVHLNQVDPWGRFIVIGGTLVVILLLLLSILFVKVIPDVMESIERYNIRINILEKQLDEMKRGVE